MNIKRTITVGAAAAALALGTSVGIAGPAMAAPVTHSAAAAAEATSTAPTYEIRFNLLVPDAPVTFTVEGKVVGTGTTNSNGDVSYFLTPSELDLEPGYHKLYAHTLYGIWSSFGFGSN